MFCTTLSTLRFVASFREKCIALHDPDFSNDHLPERRSPFLLRRSAPSTLHAGDVPGGQVAAT